MKDEVREKYAVALDGVSVSVEIKLSDKELQYHIVPPAFAAPTEAFMDTLRERLSGEAHLKRREAARLKSSELRKMFSDRIRQWIDDELPRVDAETRESMTVHILNRSLGLGNIEFLLKDPGLEEITLNSQGERIRVYHKRHGWLPTNLVARSDEEIQNYAKTIAREVGKEISISSPLLDAHLPNGDRVNAVLSALSDKGSSITIRMFARDPWTFTDFVKGGTVTPNLLALMWMMVQYEMNVLISGGTGSGKTSFLNVLMPFIPPNHRIISIEDTRELQLPEFLYWYPMMTRAANPEGEGEVTMSDLLINSLRMRPDRIVLGEIRKGNDAEILFEAMHTGHSVYATIHADTTHQTIRRLTNPPLNIPAVMVEAIHLNVVMYRDRRRNIRRVSQVAEIIPSETIGGETTLKPNILYKWKARTDEISKASDDIRLFQEASLHTGLSSQEIVEEIGKKARIIDWFVAHDVRTLYDIGRLMRSYYLDPQELLNAVEKNDPPSRILTGNA
jgi:archaeal flagellar protein FlaI